MTKRFPLSAAFVTLVIIILSGIMSPPLSGQEVGSEKDSLEQLCAPQFRNGLGFPQTCCGDGVCELGEFCPLDCGGFCGDGLCAVNEDCGSCQTDCGSCSFCGDGICNGTENCGNCTADCSGSCFAYKYQSFYRGENTPNIYYSYSQNGINWYNGGQVGPTVESSRGPAAVLFKDELYIFHRGDSSPHIRYSRSVDGVNWQGNTVLGNGARTDRSPGAAVFRDRIFVYHKGRGNRAINQSFSSDGITWSPETTIVSHSYGTDDAPTALAYADNIFLFFTNHDTGDIDMWFSASGSSSPSNWTIGESAGIVTNLKGVAATVFNGQIWVVYGENNSRRLRVKSWDFSGWSQQTYSVLTAATSERPSLTTDGNKLTLTFKGNTGPEHRYAYSFDGKTWFGDAGAQGNTKHAGPSVIYTE